MKFSRVSISRFLTNFDIDMSIEFFNLVSCYDL